MASNIKEKISEPKTNVRDCKQPSHYRCKCGFAYNALWGEWCPCCENTGTPLPPFRKIERQLRKEITEEDYNEQE